MGCDIHMVLEQSHGDKWIGINHYEQPPVRSYRAENPKRKELNHLLYPTFRVTERDYTLFAKLAGVRRDWDFEDHAPDPRGLPEDISLLTQIKVDEWGTDGHSHSWGLLSEIGGLFLASKEPQAVVMNDRHNAVLELFGIEPGQQTVPESKLEQYRLVYWFDN
jgi:hypothetical protein